MESGYLEGKNRATYISRKENACKPFFSPNEFTRTEISKYILIKFIKRKNESVYI